MGGDQIPTALSRWTVDVARWRPNVVSVELGMNDAGAGPNSVRSYVDGMRRHTVWDEVAVGAMIDRAVGYCQANPGETILSAFTRASR